jgi:hypothetical protein
MTTVSTAGGSTIPMTAVSTATGSTFRSFLWLFGKHVQHA